MLSWHWSVCCSWSLWLLLFYQILHELQDFESNRRPNLDRLARSAGFLPFQALSAQTDISGVCYHHHHPRDHHHHPRYHHHHPRYHYHHPRDHHHHLRLDPAPSGTGKILIKHKNYPDITSDITYFFGLKERHAILYPLQVVLFPLTTEVWRERVIHF